MSNREAALNAIKERRETANGLTFKVSGLEEIRKQLPGYKEFCKERAEKRKKATEEKKANNNVEG